MDKRGADGYIIKHNLIRQCQRCKKIEWEGQPIPLEIHHIDGNHYNNDTTNIQILCPNCHALTDTYKSKNRKKIKQQYYCIRCNKELSSQSKTGLCKKCCNELEQLNSKCPDKETLLKDYKELNSFSAIGRKYNVCSRTAKKWLKRLEIIN